MDRDQAIREALDLINGAEIVMVGTNGDGGFPHIKAMIKRENEGLSRVWFSTNTSSRRIVQLQRDPRTSVYVVDLVDWRGLMLVGLSEIMQDEASRGKLWHPGDEKYYPQGVMDPDYSVVRFTAQWGNYYHALANQTFELPPL
jgi:general stress protein 26